jgi:hypothetical protein
MGRFHEVSRDYKADVYILVCRKGKHREYCSLNDGQWLTLRAEVARAYLLSVIRTPINFTNRIGRRQAREIPKLGPAQGIMSDAPTPEADPIDFATEEDLQSPGKETEEQEPKSIS